MGCAPSSKRSKSNNAVQVVAVRWLDTDVRKQVIVTRGEADGFSDANAETCRTSRKCNQAALPDRTEYGL